MTTRQRNDIEVVKYFIPADIKKRITITHEDEIKYLEYSERGLHKEEIKVSHFTDGFNALVSGKQWSGRMLQIWEDTILETLKGQGGIGYIELVKDMPEPVFEFFKKEMFKGIDRNIIEYSRQKSKGGEE